MRQAQIVQSVELSTIAHATDDLEKTQVALTRLLPDPLKPRQVFTRRYLQGHYGNPIVTFEAHLTDPADIQEFTTFLRQQLSQTDKNNIARQLDRHTDDDGNLYIRIDKQKILLGTTELGQEDPVRVKMKFTKFSGKATALMAEYLGS